MRLSGTQTYMLKKLRDDPNGSRWGWGSSGTNPTGSALERRGLVEYEYDRSRPYTWGRWYITEAGRELIGAKP